MRNQAFFFQISFRKCRESSQLTAALLGVTGCINSTNNTTFGSQDMIVINFVLLKVCLNFSVGLVNLNALIYVIVFNLLVCSIEFMFCLQWKLTSQSFLLHRDYGGEVSNLIPL